MPNKEESYFRNLDQAWERAQDAPQPQRPALKSALLRPAPRGARQLGHWQVSTLWDTPTPTSYRQFFFFTRPEAIGFLNYLNN